MHNLHNLFKRSSARLALDMRILIMNICCLYEKVILNGFNIEFMHTWDRARQSTKPRFHFHRKSETLPSQKRCQGLATRQLQPQASILGESIGSSWEHLEPVASVSTKSLINSVEERHLSWREEFWWGNTVGWFISSLSKSAGRTWA